MDLKKPHGPNGTLYMLDEELKLHKKIEHVYISNGMAWTKDKKLMYFIDTDTQAVTAFDFSPSGSSLC